MFHIKDKNGISIKEGDVVRDKVGNTVAEVKFGYSNKLNITGWYVENADHWFTQPLNPTDGACLNINVEIIGIIRDKSLNEFEKMPVGRSGYGNNLNLLH